MISPSTDKIRKNEQSYDDVLVYEIETDEVLIASPSNDLASIYLMMISLLLNENYSAFESFDSDSDEDDLNREDSFET